MSIVTTIPASQYSASYLTEFNVLSISVYPTPDDPPPSPSTLVDRTSLINGPKMLFKDSQSFQYLFIYLFIHLGILMDFFFVVFFVS